MSKERFDGGGFRTDPIDGDEAAKHRHMFNEVSSNWVTISEEDVKLLKDSGAFFVGMRTLKAIILWGGPVFGFAIWLGLNYTKFMGV